MGLTLLDLLVAVAVILIIAAIASPWLVGARTAANEASAIAALRAISAAEDLYARACGQGAYAASLPRLGLPPPGSSAPFLAQTLTASPSPVNDGYTISVEPGADASPGPNDCHGMATVSSFYATAQPVTLGTTGTRSFATTGAHRIWQLVGGQAPTEPFLAPATPIQ